MPVQPRIYDVPPMTPARTIEATGRPPTDERLVELFARPQRITVDTDRRGSWVHDTFMMHAAMIGPSDDPNSTPHQRGDHTMCDDRCKDAR